MPANVDGPSVDANNLPNSLQIGKLEVQIRRLKAARDSADGQQKKLTLERQIDQLRIQQKSLYDQTRDSNGRPLDRDAVREVLNEERLENRRRAQQCPPGSADQARLNQIIQDLTAMISALQQPL
jgi:hypothetical protein